MDDFLKKMFIDEAKPALNRHSGNGGNGGIDMDVTMFTGDFDGNGTYNVKEAAEYINNYISNNPLSNGELYDVKISCVLSTNLNSVSFSLNAWGIYHNIENIFFAGTVTGVSLYVGDPLNSIVDCEVKLNIKEGTIFICPRLNNSIVTDLYSYFGTLLLTVTITKGKLGPDTRYE